MEESGDLRQRGYVSVKELRGNETWGTKRKSAVGTFVPVSDKGQRGWRGVQCLCETHFIQFLTFDACVCVLVSSSRRGLSTRPPSTQSKDSSLEGKEKSSGKRCIF